jgi:hypothetical protein
LHVFACTIQHIGPASKTNTAFRRTIHQLETRKAFNEIKNRSFSSLKYKTPPSVFSISQCFLLYPSSSRFPIIFLQGYHNVP